MSDKKTQWPGGRSLVFYGRTGPAFRPSHLSKAEKKWIRSMPPYRPTTTRGVVRSGSNTTHRDKVSGEI